MPPKCITAANTTATTYYTASIPTVELVESNTIEERIREYEEKLDKHVEQLEEDIQFFNDSRERQEQAIKELIIANVEKDKKIKILEDKIIYLDGFTGYLENKITVLEDKFNER